jgi:hypothetical protein
MAEETENSGGGSLKSILIGFATLSIGIITSLQSEEIKADAQNAFNFTSQIGKSSKNFERSSNNLRDSFQKSNE